MSLAEEDCSRRLATEGKSRTVYDSLAALNEDGGGYLRFNPDGSFTSLAVRDRAWYLVTERRG